MNKMKQENSNNKIIIYSVITIAIILIFTWTLKMTYSTSPKTNIKQTGEARTAQLKIGAKVVDIDGKKKIAIYIEPTKNSSPTLSTIQISADIKQKGINSNIKLEKGEELTNKSWSFPILNVIDDAPAKDSVTIEISAFKLGKTQYTLSNEVVIAYLPIEAKYEKSPVSININKEDTEFYAGDATTKILYQ